MVDYTSIHSRKLWFTTADWQAFGDLLTEKYPQARYFDDPTSRFDQPPEAPAVTFFEHLFGPTPRSTISLHMVFDPHWRPIVRKSWYNQETQPDDWWWSASSPNEPFVLFRGKPSKPEGFFPHFEEEVHFYIDRRDKAQLALRSQFFRLIGKLSSNRNIAFYRLPERSLMRIEKTGSYCWIGLDARRRLKENPDLFCYPGLGKDIGVRPGEAD